MKRENACTSRTDSFFGVFAILAADVFANHFVDELVLVVKLHGAFAVSAIPKPRMEFLAIRRFIIDEEHVFLFAADIGHHFVIPRPLFDVPDDFILGFMGLEFRLGLGPEFREIEFVALPLMVISGQKFPLQGEGSDFRASPTDIEDAVIEALPGYFAHEVIRG